MFGFLMRFDFILLAELYMYSISFLCVFILEAELPPVGGGCVSMASSRYSVAHLQWQLISCRSGERALSSDYPIM